MILSAEDFLDADGRTRVAKAISESELGTSAEIRVHIEEHIEEDVLDHAAYIFEELGMQHTLERNGVLIYISVADRAVAVIGDKGINERVPDGFWNDMVGVLQQYFVVGRQADGLCEAVSRVAEQLARFFPVQADDRNELPNEVSFGR